MTSFSSIRVFLSIFLCIASTGFANAQQRPLYEIDKNITQHEKTSGALRRSASVVLDESLFRLTSIPKGTSLRLPTFDGEKEAVVSSVRAHGPDALALSGELAGDASGHFTLTLHGDDMALSIHDHKSGWLRLTGTPRGYELQEFDVDALPGCGSGNIPQIFRRAGDRARERAEAPPMPVKGGEPVQIDLLVVYTEAARLRAGSTGAMEALILNAADQANLAYANSAIDLNITVVHMEEVVYEEDYELALALAKLTFPNDGVMDEVHALRNTHEADMVSLITSDGNVGGIGWILDALEGNIAVQAFSITNYGNLGSLTFAHELGHNMGCDHDQQNITAEGYRLFNYSRGWRFTGEDDGLLYRTVMSYAPGGRIPYFSNPDISYKGTPTGVALGLPDEAHCALTINTSAPQIALNRPGTGEGEGEGGDEETFDGYYCEILGNIYNNTLLRNLLPGFATELFDLLYPTTADLNGGADPETLTFLGNGMLDCAYELGMLREIIVNTNLNLSSTGGVTHTEVLAALTSNRAQLFSDIGTLNANLVNGIAPGLLDVAVAFMTIGDDDSVGFVTALLDIINRDYYVGVLDPQDYTRLPHYLSPDGDADGDLATNREEYNAYAAFGASTYISFALNPSVNPTLSEGEGALEGEGDADGEGAPLEGEPEGSQEAEGSIEAEGIGDGEGAVEGVAEGEGEEQPIVPHTADQDGDLRFSLNELLRVIQFYNAGAFSCVVTKGESEDGYQPGSEGDQLCEPHDSDYEIQDWSISLSELLRMIQLFNLGGYTACEESPDGVCSTG